MKAWPVTTGDTVATPGSTASRDGSHSRQSSITSRAFGRFTTSPT